MGKIIQTLNDGIIVPAHFQPRWYQEEIFDAFESGFKRIIELWHRKTGKDLTAIALMAIAMLQRIGNYYYFFPEYSQGRRILWQGKCADGIPFMDRIPKELIIKKRDSDMFIELCNGSTLNIVGVDKFTIDSMIGIGPVGVVMSEYGVGKAYGIVLDYFRPALRQTNGWMLLNGTCRGKNHYYDLVKRVRQIPDRWFVSSLQTISPTYPTGRYTGLVTPTELSQEIEEGMDPQTLEQEYGVSFNAGVKGSIFGTWFNRAEQTGRVGQFPTDDNLWVETLWDLGNADNTVIWFRQMIGERVIWMDYFQSHDEDWAYYVKVLQDKGYKYRHHYLPHDSKHRHLMSKFKPIDMLKDYVKESGIGGKVIALRKPTSKKALIQATRRRFCYYYFDEGKCKEGIALVEKYHRRYDAVLKVFMDEPVHDDASHCCDALMLEPLIRFSPIEIDQQYSPSSK